MKIKARKNDDGSVDVKTKWLLLEGKAGKGDLDAEYKDGVLNVEIRPFNRPVVDMEVFWLPEYADAEKTNMKYLKFGFNSESQGKSLASYLGELDRVNTTQVYSTDFHSEFEVSKGNRIYIIMCKLGERLGSGCFNSRKLKVKTFFDKVNKNYFLPKYSFYASNEKVTKWLFLR